MKKYILLLVLLGLSGCYSQIPHFAFGDLVVAKGQQRTGIVVQVQRRGPGFETCYNVVYPGTMINVYESQLEKVGEIDWKDLSHNINMEKN